ERNLPVVSSIDHKHSHAHPEVVQCLADQFLLSNWSSQHSIVFQGTEALVCHKFQLVDDATGSRISKHPKVRCKVHLESRCCCIFTSHSRDAHCSSRAQKGATQAHSLDKSSSFHDYTTLVLPGIACG